MTAETTAPDKALAPVPDEIEKEEALVRNENLSALSLKDPEEVERRLEAREKNLQTMRRVAIRSTHAYDWTLYKDREGRVIGVPRDSGLVHIRQWLGISIFNYRPKNEHGEPEPRVYKDPRPDGSYATVVELTADAVCALTGQPLEGVTFSIRSDDDFIGRERKVGGKEGQEYVSQQDMKASCRTGLDSKITRMLSGLRKVPAATLKELNIDIDQAHQGRGFGTSAERGATRVAEEGVAEGREKLKNEILKRVGGDISAARQVTIDITSNPQKGFKGFDTVDRLTQGWQVENAWKKLKEHQVFGDHHQAPGQGQEQNGGRAPAGRGRGREPGED